MAAGVQARMAFSVNGKQIGVNDISEPVVGFALSKAVNFLPGSANQDEADVLWMDERSLASAATENLDLAGALSDSFGQSVSPAEIVGIWLEALATNTTDLAFFGAASNAFNGPLSGTTPKVTLGPGDAILLTSRRGWTVTPATGDILLAANGSGAAAGYRVAIIGRTVAR